MKEVIIIQKRNNQDLVSYCICFCDNVGDDMFVTLGRHEMQKEVLSLRCDRVS